MAKSNYTSFIIICLVLGLSIISPVLFYQAIYNKKSQDLVSKQPTRILTGNNETFKNSDVISGNTQFIKQNIGLQWLLDQGYNGKNVTIGIVDSGIESNLLSEFGSRILAQKSFVSTNNNYGGNDTSLTDTYRSC